MAVFKGSLIIFLFWLRPRKRVRRGYNAPNLPDDLSQCTLARPGQRLCHSKVADYRKRHPLISNRSHSHRAGKKKKVGVEWKWAVCHKELLHYKRACPWKKETKSYGRFSFQAPVRCQNCWRAGMNEEHNDWKLSHLFSLAVCKLSVNRRLSADADINDVFFFFFSSSVWRCCFIWCFLAAAVYHLHYWKSERGMRRREECDYAFGRLLINECVCLIRGVHVAHPQQKVCTRVVCGPQCEPSATCNVLNLQPHKRRSHTRALLRPLICMTKAWLII